MTSLAIIPDTLNWLYWSLFIAYIVTILSIVGVVLSENRNPLKSLAWITVLLLLPVGGIILYIFFGRNIKNRRMISRRNRRRLLKDGSTSVGNGKLEDLTGVNYRIATMARSLSGGGLYENNGIDIYFNGEDKFKAFIADIKQARSYIHLQYYIFEDDTLGSEVAAILKERSRAGVKVRIIYDHIGSLHVNGNFFKEMREARIEVFPFFKVAFPPFASKINWRNHRKIVVIDGQIGYIGGMNIADRYIDGGKKFESWRDTHVRLTGPAVAALQYSFAVDWNFMGQPLIEEEAGGDAQTGENVGIQLITSGPTSRWSNVALVFLKAISSATKRIYLQTPYFLPTESLNKALQAAALSGVDVRVMIPRHSDSVILTNASFSYVHDCIRAGVKVYLYDAGMLHAKTMIVDDDCVTIGSTNFDYRSFEHNFEGNIIIYSADVNKQMVKQFHEDMKKSTRIKIAEWRKRPVLQKTKESIFRLLSPIL
ncbi:MAG: cardiolipin synthase [Muribaculaceae bacterium]|nr:cardiolipin synthase [Muribaculaceae bacterium]